MLMTLLHDIKVGKSAVQREVDALESERTEIRCLKMDHVAQHFEQTLAELPLGEHGHANSNAETSSSSSSSASTTNGAGGAAGAQNHHQQHKSDGIHAMLCKIARRCRSRQELYVQELLLRIRDAEESFIKGGDITLKINDLNAMADHIGDGTKMQGTMGLVQTMSLQQENGDVRLRAAVLEATKWKGEFENMRRELTKVKVLNAFSNFSKVAKDGTTTTTTAAMQHHLMQQHPGLTTHAAHHQAMEAAASALASGGKNGGRQADAIYAMLDSASAAASSTGWGQLPDNWKKVASKCLRVVIKKKAVNHPRCKYVSDAVLSVIVSEAAEHAKENFGYMLLTSATNAHGGGSIPDANVESLCYVVLDSLAMERELYPLVSMYLTYGGERTNAADLNDDDGATDGAATEDIGGAGGGGGDSLKDNMDLSPVYPYPTNNSRGGDAYEEEEEEEEANTRPTMPPPTTSFAKSAPPAAAAPAAPFANAPHPPATATAAAPAPQLPPVPPRQAAGPPAPPAHAHVPAAVHRAASVRDQHKSLVTPAPAPAPVPAVRAASAKSIGHALPHGSSSHSSASVVASPTSATKTASAAAAVASPPPPAPVPAPAPAAPKGPETHASPHLTSAFSAGASRKASVHGAHFASPPPAEEEEEVAAAAAPPPKARTDKSRKEVSRSQVWGKTAEGKGLFEEMSGLD